MTDAKEVAQWMGAEETFCQPDQNHWFACPICTPSVTSATLLPSNTALLKLTFAVRFVVVNGFANRNDKVNDE